MQPIEGAVIAAAGLGSRLGLGLPKCMLKINGQTILSRLIATLEPLVPRIHVVVGYREELVIDHCATYHRNVVLVRNPDFRSTNTAASMALGARGLRGKVLFLDGDLLLSAESIARFVQKARDVPTLIGITPASSEHAVFVQTDAADAAGDCYVRGFTREIRTDFEWANVVVADPLFVLDAPGFVYQELERSLPLPARVIELAEVDTPDDLVRAEAFCRRMEPEFLP